MKVKFILFIILTSYFWINDVNGEANDSKTVSKIVTEFYQWYATVTNNQQTDEYQPKFVKDKKGMVTLDYSKYVNNLEGLNFSKELIHQEIEGYKKCINSINKIKFADESKNLSDLEDYENIGCDFFNAYRWTYTMDNIDGAKPSKIVMNGNTCIVIVQLYNYNSKTKEYFYWPEKHAVILKKANNSWKIIEIK